MSDDEAAEILKAKPEGRTAKDRGYAYGGKARTKYLPGALPSTWAQGDPSPTDALRYDPPADDDPSSERGNDGDDHASTPLDQMAESDPAPGETTDPEQGKFRGPPWPDRKTDPYGWEMFFKGLMRQSPWAMRQTPWTLAKAMLGTSSICAYCNREFEQADAGRPREYCTAAHKQKAYNERRTRRVTKVR